MVATVMRFSTSLYPGPNSLIFEELQVFRDLVRGEA